MYTISHIPVPRMYLRAIVHAFLMFFFFFHFLFIFILLKTRVRAIVHTFFMFFLFIPPEVSVTSTLHFCDTLHFHHQQRQQRMPLGHPLSSKDMFLAPQAHKEEKGPKRRQTHRLGPRCVFIYIIFLRFTDNNGPKRRRHVVWAVS